MTKTFAVASVRVGRTAEMLRRQGTIDSELSLEGGRGGREEEEEEEEEGRGPGQGSVVCEGGGVCDWTDSAVADVHMFVPSSSGVETCYLGPDCPLSTTTADRLKCVACRLVTHGACRSLVQEKIRCKTTFNQSGVRKYREVGGVSHHWVWRRQIKGKCRHCGKAFQSKVGQRTGRQNVKVKVINCKMAPS